MDELVHSIYGKEFLISEVDEWIRFVALCTDHEIHAGSKQYLDLLNFLFNMRDALKGELVAEVE